MTLIIPDTFVILFLMSKIKWVWLNRYFHVSFSVLYFRIQNMRMIDGKPEYKNGLVSEFVLLCVCVRAHACACI